MSQESESTKVMNGLKELGALLLLLCTWLILLQPYGALRQYGSNDYTQFLSVDFLYIATTLIMAAFGFVLGFHILSRSNNTILQAQIYFTVSFINQACWVAYFTHNTGFKEVFVTYSPEDIIKMFVVPPLAIAWLIYFTKSERLNRLFAAGAGSHSYAANPALSPTSPPVQYPEIDNQRCVVQSYLKQVDRKIAAMSETDFQRAISEIQNENGHENNNRTNNENQGMENMQSDTTQTGSGFNSGNTGKMGQVLEFKEKYNLGIVLRIIGIFLLFAFPIGTIAGVGLIIAGWKMSKKYACSECGNLLSRKEVKFCTTCKTTLAPFQPAKKSGS